jgi:hypothetical protein
MRPEVDFNDLVIRKNYLIKTSGRNLDQKIKKFENNIKITSSMMYNKFIHSFQRSGFDHDDIFSLSKLYSLYYFDLYMDEKDGDEKKEKNGLITFIRQRMEYLANVCERQSSNFHVSKNLSGFYAKTSQSKDLPDDVIIANPSEYGYRRVYETELKRIKKSSKGAWVDANGYEVVKLEFYDKITPEEYRDVLYANADQTPEDTILKLQETEKFQAKVIQFEEKGMVDKIKYLNNIIKRSKDADKVRSAKELLKIIKKKNEAASREI